MRWVGLLLSTMPVPKQRERSSVPCPVSVSLQSVCPHPWDLCLGNISTEAAWEEGLALSSLQW